MADPIYKNSESVGKDGADLVLKTAGKVVVKVKDRYYQLNFKDTNSSKTINTIIVNDGDEVTNSLVDIVKDTLFITKNGEQYLYIFDDNKLVKLGETQSDIISTFDDVVINGDLTVLGNISVDDNTMIKNLNAEYLDGKKASDFIQNNINNTIKGEWTFNDTINTNKINGTNNNYIDLSSGVLNIDTIQCSKLISDDCTCSNDLGDSNIPNNSDTSEDSSAKNVLIDSISAKTYINNTPRIVNVNSLGFSTIEDLEVKKDWEIVLYGFNEYGITGTGVPITEYDLLNSLYTFTDIDENGNEVEEFLDEDYLSQLNQYTISIKESSNWDNWTVDGVSLREFVNQNQFDKSLVNQDNEYILYELDLTFNNFKVNDTVLIESIDGLVTFTIYKIEGKKIWILTENDCSEEDQEDIITDCIKNKDPFKYGIVFSQASSNIIGNLNDSSNSFFGSLSGWGLSMESNCYLLNPEVALQKNNINYLLLSNTRPTFIGLSNSGHFLQLDNNGYGNITTNNLQISSNNTYLGKSSSGHFFEIDNNGYGHIKNNNLHISDNETYIGKSDSGNFFKLNSSGHGSIETSNLLISPSKTYIGKSTSGNFLELDSNGYGSITTNDLYIASNGTYIGKSNSGHFLELDSNGYGKIQTNFLQISDNKTYIGKSDAGNFFELDSNGYGSIKTNYLNISSSNTYIGKSNIGNFLEIDANGYGHIKTQYSHISDGETYIGKSNTGHFLELDSSGYGHIKNSNLHISDSETYIGKSAVGYFLELDVSGNGSIKTQYSSISDAATYIGIYKSGKFLELDSNGYGHMRTDNLHISDSEVYIGKSNVGHFLSLDSNGNGSIKTDYACISDAETYIGKSSSLSGHFLDIDSTGKGLINTKYLKISDNDTYIGKSTSGHFISLDGNGYGALLHDHITVTNTSFSIITPTFNLNSDWSGNIGPKFKWDSDGNITNEGGIKLLYSALLDTNGNIDTVYYDIGNINCFNINYTTISQRYWLFYCDPPTSRVNYDVNKLIFTVTNDGTSDSFNSDYCYYNVKIKTFSIAYGKYIEVLQIVENVHSGISEYFAHPLVFSIFG